jgi:cellulose synthase/poly-beta-1,6-N-acetylglucosamine synthase-like glycosyltransferase
MRRETLLRVPYGAVSVVEDAEYHLRLIEADLSVRFVESAAVYADVPVHGKGVTSQRTRWEGGRLRLCFEQAPKLMAQILKGRMQAVEPLLDLLLLPLAFHVALLVAATILSSGPVRLASMFGLFAVAVHILTAIASDGDWQDVAALGAAPFYVLWKLALVPRLLKSAAGRQAWVRTERASERSRT